LSHELGWPLPLLKEIVTLQEFEQWQAYFNRRKREHDKTDWYLASIAHIIGRTMGGAKNKLEDYLLKFQKPVAAKQTYSLQDSKAAWLLALGIKE